MRQPSFNALQWGRYLLERWLLVPAARLLPIGVAMSVAGVAAAIDVLVPTETRRAALAEVFAATGHTGWRGAVLAWERLATPRHELVYLTRMSAGRERLSDWRIIEHNAQGVRALAEGGQPFVIATGHFSSSALNVLQQTLPRPAAYVAGEAAAVAQTPAELRRQLGDRTRDAGRDGLLGSRYAAHELWIRMPDLWGPDAAWNNAAQRIAAAKQMLTVLRRCGGIVLVRVDAVWGASSGMARPFAGEAERPFALGAARVARLAQCPVVPLVAVMGREPRTILAVWGDPIPPPAKTDEAADTATLDRALAHIERGVGRFPTQYLAHIGWDRHWRRQTQMWESA